MIALRWIAVLSVALIFGGIVTQFYKRNTKQIVGDEDHHFRIAIPIVFPKQILQRNLFEKTVFNISYRLFRSFLQFKKRVNFWINTNRYVQEGFIQTARVKYWEGTERFFSRLDLRFRLYPDFDSFTKAISQCLAKTNGDYKKELDSFLSLNFQSFSKSHIMTG